jgi:subtilisin family serine protease
MVSLSLVQAEQVPMRNLRHRRRAGPVSIHDKQEPHNGFQRDRHLTRPEKEPEHAPATTRLFIKYKNERGKEGVLARSQRVYNDNEQKGIMVAQVDRDGVEFLEQDENILSLEEDHLWRQEGTSLDRFVDAEHARRLSNTETIPYGITMVQGDQLDVGPSPVQVCIIDTGLAGNHPDLDLNNINGSNRSSNIDGSELYWNEDVFGHGTHVAVSPVRG